MHVEVVLSVDLFAQTTEEKDEQSNRSKCTDTFFFFFYGAQLNNSTLVGVAANKKKRNVLKEKQIIFTDLYKRSPWHFHTHFKSFQWLPNFV